MMMKIYGSSMCPGCRECKATFDAKGIEYEFIDINESLPNLKAFLALRDALPLYDGVKAKGGIGIPTLVLEDGSVTLDWKPVSEAKGAACTLESGKC